MSTQVFNKNIEDNNFIMYYQYQNYLIACSLNDKGENEWRIFTLKIDTSEKGVSRTLSKYEGICFIESENKIYYYERHIADVNGDIIHMGTEHVEILKETVNRFINIMITCINVIGLSEVK